MQTGDKIPELKVTPDKYLTVRYAGASGDFNPIHWNDRTAVAVGLPGVIAHGMFTMALAGRALCEWTGDAGAVVEFGVRFSKPVPVPDDEAGTWVEVDSYGRCWRPSGVTVGWQPYCDG